MRESSRDVWEFASNVEIPLSMVIENRNSMFVDAISKNRNSILSSHLVFGYLDPSGHRTPLPINQSFDTKGPSTVTIHTRGLKVMI